MHLQEISPFGAKHFICSLHLPILCFVEEQHLYVIENGCIQAGLPACFAKCNLCYSGSKCNPSYSGNASELSGKGRENSGLYWCGSWDSSGQNPAWGQVCYEGITTLFLKSWQYKQAKIWHGGRHMNISELRAVGFQDFQGSRRKSQWSVCQTKRRL